jgi:poly-gamma-glutamate capsule biosynthesis protein CapA/YwtB (metallophosphatase superfamily)
MKILTCCLFLTGLFVSNTTAMVLKGKIVNERGAIIEQVRVSSDGLVVNSSQTGDFELDTATADWVTLSISKNGYYSSVHTFSRTDFTAQQSESVYTLPRITLVKKHTGRTLFAFAGDAMMGRRYSEPYFNNKVLIRADSKVADTRELVRYMQPYLQLADYAVINLETQIAEDEPEERARKSVTFYSPPETLQALSWAGVDYVTLGNNHTFDYLDSGLESTLKYLNNSELAYSGAGVNQKAALQPHHVTLSEHHYDMLGYVGWEGSARPSQIARKDKGGAAWGSMENIVQSVSKSVAQGRSPIVQYHGSLEYTDEPTGVTEQRLKAAIDSGAVMAIAHHPHVTQGLELYKGKLIAYSMGNFIFDQFFYSTPHSFVLYVWMDGADFHRAEVIPIYLKGYQPTPAMGIDRTHTLKRLDVLSQQRQVKLSMSGGHGVISKDMLSKQTRKNIVSIKGENRKVIALHSVPWDAAIKQVKVDNNQPYRFGLSLTNGGDFENWDNFSSAERGWLVSHNDHQIITQDSNKRLALKVADQPILFGMQNFRRVYQADTASSVRMKLQSEQPFTLKVYWQGRKTRQSFFEALKSDEMHLVGQYDYAGGDWQEVTMDFNSPRIGYRSYRLMMEISAGSRTVLLDDVDLIEWQTSFTDQLYPPRMNVGALQASFIGFKDALKGDVQFTLEK